MECNTLSLEWAEHQAGIVNAGSSTEWEGQVVSGVCVYHVIPGFPGSH